MKPVRHWLISRLYYAVDTRDQDSDLRGDRLALALYPDLLAVLRKALPEAQLSWMRFCAQGYHLRLQIRADQAQLRERAQPLVEAQVATLLARHADWFSGRMVLPDLAQRVSARFAPDTETLQPGTHVLDLLPDEVVPALSESTHALLAAESAHSLDLLRQGRRYAGRLRHWRLYVAQLLRRLDLPSPQTVAVLRGIEASWRQQFGFAAGQVGERAAQLQTWMPAPLLWSRPRLGQDAEPHDRVAALDAADLRGLRRRALDGLAQRDLLALWHLSANRMGVSLLDEAAAARVLADWLDLQEMRHATA